MGKIIISLFFFTLITFSCNEPNLPKQNGFLRIEFKEPYYTIHEEIDNPFNFYYNSNYTYIVFGKEKAYRERNENLVEKMRKSFKGMKV